MKSVQHFFISISKSRSHLTMGIVVLSLIGAAGCDPCLNNPCDDGLVCNGTETCTASGGGFNCLDGTPIECQNDQVCVEITGACAECEFDFECDDDDLCTTDTCTADGACVNVDVMCAAGETCDPATGECMASGTVSPPATLVGAAGNYTGATSCGDDDDMVTIVNNNGMLTLTGFTGNGDITITLTDDLTGTASGVTAFGMGDHTLMVTLDPATGDVSLHLENGNGGSCDSTLVSMP